jgi:hypothetical protein
MYAQGKKALGICDRCGFTYKLSELKYEIEDSIRNGLRVCSSCFDPDQPQLKVGELQTSDPQSLFNPRTDTGEIDSTTYYGFNPVSSTGMVIRASLGEITLEGVVAGSPTPSPSPSPSPSPDTATPTAVTGTTGLGSVTATGASSITTYTVTVASYYSANYFYIDGSRAVTLNLTEGQTYRFSQSDSSNSSHPLRFSTTSNGTHGGGSEYTTGVTTNGTPGSSGAYTQIEVASGAPTLYYYCTNHSGMGGQINT